MPDTLPQCIEREREAEDALVRESVRGERIHIRPAEDELAEARAATDEAVRKVEAAMRAAFRLLTGGDALGDAEWRECTDTVAAYVRGCTTTPARTAQGESTGGRDE